MSVDMIIDDKYIGI